MTLTFDSDGGSTCGCEHSFSRIEVYANMCFQRFDISQVALHGMRLVVYSVTVIGEEPLTLVLLNAFFKK